MKIGIFGGSFNPPHNMHKDISLKLINKSCLDKVVYVPTGDSYNKRDLISFIDRYNMVELMVSGNDSLNVSDIGNSNNHQYTYQILDYFREIYLNDEIYFICGSDNLLEFDTWREYQYILENYKILVIKRNGDDVNKILSKYTGYIDRIFITDIESNVLSSTFLRRNINNSEINKYLDIDVLNYINQKGLYYGNSCDRRLQRKL